MASFDVTSLFTNIPLDETVDMISNQILESTYFRGLIECELRKLLCLAIKSYHFIFNGVVYQQIDGVAMGSPIGPLFANILAHEKDWLNECPTEFKPLLYRHYVDDCFVLSHHNVIPPQYKCILIFSLVHCFYKICSNHENFHNKLLR